MAEYVNKIGKGFRPEPYHHPNGFINPGEKVPTTAELADACKKTARFILAPAMERLLKEKERMAGDQ